LLSRNANGYVSSFGEIGGLSTMNAVKGLELVPYTVANLDRQRTGGNPLINPSALGGAAGLDMKYAVTPGLTLNATVNPDFGQVEADPAVVNLSAFETFFNERRPFFVEGGGNFRFDADCYDGCNNLFYSRRIGRAPQGTGNLPYGDGIYTDSPTQSTILGAAKLTGRVGKYSIGVMHALTQEEFGDVSTLGLRSEQVVEPSSSYSVARVKREFADQSYVGIITTATNRRLPASLSFLPTSAYVGGTDFDWRGIKKYSLNGFIEGSRVNGSASAIETLQENSRHQYQRPDLQSDHLDVMRTSLSGCSARSRSTRSGASSRIPTRTCISAHPASTRTISGFSGAPIRSGRATGSRCAATRSRSGSVSARLISINGRRGTTMATCSTPARTSTATSRCSTTGRWAPERSGRCRAAGSTIA
jgi:hypothetical protein